MAQRNRGSRNRNSRPSQSKPSPKPSPRSQARSKASASRSRSSYSRPSLRNSSRPSSRPSNRPSTQRASRPGSVAANRAAGTNKATQNQLNRLNGNSSRNNQGARNNSSSQLVGPVQDNRGGRQGNRNTSNMTVGERRADARDRGMTMRQYKAFTQDQQTTKKQTPQERRDANRPLIKQDVSKASDYNFGAFRKGSVNSGELQYLRKAGMSRDDIAQAAADSGLRLGKAAKNKLGRWEDRKNVTDETVIPDTETIEPGVGDTYNEYITNPEVQPTPSPTAPPGPGTSPIPPTNPIVPPTPPTVPSVVMPTPGVFPGIPGGGGPGAPTLPTFDGSFSVGGDLDQNVGKQGDMTTTIGNDNTFGAGSSIGNDMSVTIGVNQAGNNNGGFGGAMGGPYNPLSSMQSAAAYGVLNTNAWHRSQAQLNGYGRAAGASSEAARITGAPQRVSNLYNFAGQTQNYWNNKATAQQGFYLGDMFNFQAPNWQMPPDPKLPEDETEEIADSMSF